MAEITIDGLTKRYGDGTLAVDDLSLDIADGELMILVGPSGCGKSSALRMVAGLEDITDGELRVDGMVVNEHPPKDRDVAMVFQNYALYPHMSVARNMGFALEMSGIDKAEIERRVRFAAEILELTEQLDRRPGKLSGGQRQRVAMGRAIVREPKAFLMDEPLSNLDAKLRVQMRVEIARLQRELGTTTMYVTHDQTEAMTLGDRVAVMREGVLQQVATPEELYEHPANLFVAGFIGSPAMNLLDGRLAGREVRTPLGILALSAPARRAAELRGPADGRVVIGLRPEAFEDPALPQSGDADVDVEVDVDVVESVGSDLYVHARAGDGTLVVRLSPASRPTPGDRMRLAIRREAIKLFDRATGRAINT